MKLGRLILPLYLLICIAILPIASLVGGKAPARNAGPRRLVLILDGVPWQVIADLKAEGGFRHFNQPARMVSTFPSLTNPSMIEILHANESPGYEDHFFDREANRLRGSIQDRLSGASFIRGTFRETFDYHAPAFKGSLGYIAAPAGAMMLAQLDLIEFRKEFESSDAQFFVGYIGETDSLAHLGGEWPLKSFLRTVDRTIEEMIAESGGTLEVEMFSDHGNRFDEYRQVELNDAIEKAGFKPVKTLTDDQSVVIPKYGLVGSTELFTAPQNRARLAAVCSAVEGVDFALYPHRPDVIRLISEKGRAQIHRRDNHYSYEDLGGDPLGLQPLIGGMRSRGELNADGFASEDDWWRATRSHRYADPLRRISNGFNRYIENRADVIVSYEDGWLLGSPFLSVFAEMRATHGNLLRGETDGFAMSTRRDLGEAVRGTELNDLFALDQRRKAGIFLSGASGHCRIGSGLAMQVAAVD
ncbi:MAG: hypothetical protein AB7H86_17695 [Blastocatellales bacterium]